MDKRQFQQRLRKYLAGKEDETSRKQVDEWFDSFGYDKSVPPLDDEVKAKRIQHVLEERLTRHVHMLPVRRGIGVWLSVAAASVTLALGVLWWSTSEKRQSVSLAGAEQRTMDTLAAEVGKMKKVVLPDQSTVWLNANTQIRYDHQHFLTKREIILDYGEAFFEVTKNPAKPFVVHMDDLHTTVLGTAFNVKHYAELTYAVIQVESGKVAISAKGDKLQDTLMAGKGIRYDRTGGVFSKADLFAADAGSWREGRILLEDATFEELAMVIYNRFQVRLQTELPAASGFRYTMTILQHKSLEETIQLICNVHQINYRREGHEITIY
ncbi:FecR family protein [Parapedobacter tibetensis]|uniref:FecR family protein n=1 Tax=Parapedobacter tibetensis TaxID=2972951 RepID=UPI00214DB0F6|nr:FecR family protein [Parapedobacter tibetensis]